MKTRSLVALATAVVLISIATASAASLGALTSSDLGAGGDDVNRCDNAFTFNFTLVDNNVTEVIVGGISSNCNGGQMSVVLANSAGTNIGDGSDSSVGAPTETVTINEAPPAANVDDVHVVIEGGS